MPAHCCQRIYTSLALTSCTDGTLVGGSAEAAITTLHPKEDHYEQSSEEIWNKCGEAVRRAVAQAGISAAAVKVRVK